MKQDGKVFAEQRLAELQLLDDAGDEFDVPAWCFICKGRRRMHVDYLYSYPVHGRRVPNWRERLVCDGCGLTNRVRATLHLIQLLVHPAADATIYLTEQTSTLHRWFTEHYRAAFGSEFLGDGLAPASVDERGIRHEDLTGLGIPSASVDLIVTLDVLEHVPDYRAALVECSRVLKPGGVLFLTAPFRSELAATLVRARLLSDGSVEHLLEPEYHCNPVDPDRGSLAFYLFGWDLLGALADSGLGHAEAILYWSREFGYLGVDQVAFLARK